MPLELLAPVDIERLVRVSVLRCSIEAVVEDEEVRPCVGATHERANRALFDWMQLHTSGATTDRPELVTVIDFTVSRAAPSSCGDSIDLAARWHA